MNKPIRHRKPFNANNLTPDRLDPIHARLISQDPTYRRAMEMLDSVRRKDDPVYLNVWRAQVNMAHHRQSQQVTGQ